MSKITARIPRSSHEPLEFPPLLGVHILGTAATELVHIGQAFLTLGGTLDVLVETVFNDPTFAECYKVAALDAYNKLGPAPAAEGACQAT
jgi:NAD(P) transhydrogenase